MAGENERETEPEWVHRLRARGHQVEGGEGDFPEEPRVAFEPVRSRVGAAGLRNVLAWFIDAGTPLVFVTADRGLANAAKDSGFPVFDPLYHRPERLRDVAGLPRP